MNIEKRQLEKEQKIIDFFLNQTSLPKNEFYTQFHNSRINRDYSPYFYIIDFDVKREKVLPFNEVVNHIVSIQVSHSGNEAPTCFDLQIIDGYIHMFEVYNVDSSMLNYDNMYTGVISKNMWTPLK